VLTERQRNALHSFATGETSGFAVGSAFLETFRTSTELGPFFAVWFVEELNHYWGYHRYLERMGAGWSSRRSAEVTGVSFVPYSADPMEVAAANMYQELIGYLVYRSFARQVGDPFLARMVATFAKDELRHYKFYQEVVAREIQRRPGFRAVVLKHFLKATTPLNQVSGGARKVVEHLTTVSCYVRKPEFDFMMKQLEFLMGRSLRAQFSWFFRRQIPPCTRCSREVFSCLCSEHEADAC
jgi:hypothetical protein